MMPVAIGFDLVPGSVRKGLFLASLLKGASAAKGQRAEGMTENMMNDYVMGFVMGLTIAVIGRYVMSKPTTRDVGTQVNIDEKLAKDMQRMSVAELKFRCGQEQVHAGSRATLSTMIALLSARYAS